MYIIDYFQEINLRKKSRICYNRYIKIEDVVEMSSNAEVLKASITAAIKQKRAELQQIQEQYHKVANEVDVLLQQSICQHEHTESYGTECVTVRCKDCNAEWYDSY